MSKQTTARRQQPKDEMLRKAEKIYARLVRDKGIEDRYWGCYIVIDVDTGEYVISHDSLKASQRFDAKFPRARSMLMGIGEPIRA